MKWLDGWTLRVVAPNCLERELEPMFLETHRAEWTHIHRCVLSCRDLGYQFAGNSSKSDAGHGVTGC